jgi:hypothetical protein
MLGKRKGLGTENIAPHNLVLQRHRRLAAVGRLVRLQRRFGRHRQRTMPAWPCRRDADRDRCRRAGWMFAEWIIAKKPSVLGMISGAVAGLVAITPASGFVDPVGALIIGSPPAWSATLGGVGEEGSAMTTASTLGRARRGRRARRHPDRRVRLQRDQQLRARAGSSMAMAIRC